MVSGHCLQPIRAALLAAPTKQKAAKDGTEPATIRNPETKESNVRHPDFRDR